MSKSRRSDRGSKLDVLPSVFIARFDHAQQESLFSVLAHQTYRANSEAYAGTFQYGDVPPPAPRCRPLLRRLFEARRVGLRLGLQPHLGEFLALARAVAEQLILAGEILRRAV